MGDEHSAGTPRVSVILPTYNQAEYLPLALDSIFQQTWRDFELIVVNDGSTDATPKILERYHSQYAGRCPFHVVHQANQKLPRALNEGFRRARGEYLTWTSSDNVLHPGMLEALVEALNHNPDVGLVYADWEEIDEAGRVLRTIETCDYNRLLLLRLNFVNACFLYRRACQENVGFYDPEYIYAEDWEYWIRISRRFKMRRVPRVLYQYRTHAKSLTETVVTKEQAKRNTPGSQGRPLNKMEQLLRANRLDWYLSKIVLEWHRWSKNRRRKAAEHRQPGAEGLHGS
jgi:glycosyltransferase involved in cell wall biosynthesis